MAKPLLSDELWEEITALLPPPKPRRFSFPGRKPVDNRKVFTGILFVLKSGIPWEALPREMGCGSGMTCWRRLYEWQKAGVWQSVHELLVAKLPEADKIDWSRALVGRTSVATPTVPSVEAVASPLTEDLQPLPLPDIPLDPVPLSERYAA
jgi:transposase